MSTFLNKPLPWVPVVTRVRPVRQWECMARFPTGVVSPFRFPDGMPRRFRLRGWVADVDDLQDVAVGIGLLDLPQQYHPEQGYHLE